MKPYILLTPGPLTTSETVKEAMLTDWCTWDADYNVHIVEEIRKSLVALATKQTDEYTSVLLQGSGTYCVEAVIGSTVKPGDKLLILSNGAYGDRMGNIAEYHGINYDMLAFDETEQVSVSYVDDYLAHNAEITHVSVVHCETTTGVLNPLKEIAHIVKMHGKKLIVDAMSSFGGVPLDVEELGIDFLISSANKCIQGVPGFGFIIARKSELMRCKGVSKSLSLDIYDQWETMEKGGGKWRFPSPTHVVALLTKKSISSFFISIGTPPKLLIASTIKVMLRPFKTSATSSIGFSRPVVVSLCTIDRCVISGLASRALRATSPVTNSVSCKETSTWSI